MIGREWGASPVEIGIFLALLVFGVIYNYFVTRRPRHEMDAFVSLYVAGGVLVTLAGAALIDWKAAVLVLICFVFSGTPMVLGSLYRFSKLESKLLDYTRGQIEEHERSLGEK